MTVLRTPRLLLREFAEDDLDELTAIMADPEVTRYLGDGEAVDRADCWRFIALALGHQRLRGYALWAAVVRDTGRLVGRVGLWYPEGWPGLEVGWVLGRASWGRGYATELAAACRDYAFDVVGTDELISLIYPDNVRSVAVAERIGHRHLRDTVFKGEPCRVYGQRRPPAR
jgi:RimJ/RimL family protein N-acetyltransferase